MFTKPVTLSTRPVPGFEIPKQAQLVRGRSCSRVTLAIIPLGVGTADSAFDDALAQAPGSDTLLEWRLKTDVISILGTIIYFQHCVIVEGYAVNSHELMAQSSDRAATAKLIKRGRARRDQ